MVVGFWKERLHVVKYFLQLLHSLLVWLLCTYEGRRPVTSAVVEQDGATYHVLRLTSEQTMIFS